MRVVAAGTFRSGKRPEMFLELAKRYPEVNFIWYGNGERVRESLIAQAADLGIHNLEFPGFVTPEQLGEALRKADDFAMPSRTEGVPKVTQEAAACGLPIVLFGYYEAPSVVHGQNGFVVWDDDAFFKAISDLLLNSDKRDQMGQASIMIAKEWDWDAVAKQWEARLIELVSDTN